MEENSVTSKGWNNFSIFFLFPPLIIRSSSFFHYSFSTNRNSIFKVNPAYSIFFKVCKKFQFWSWKQRLSMHKNIEITTINKQAKKRYTSYFEWNFPLEIDFISDNEMVTVVQILRIKTQNHVIEFREILIETFHIRDNSMDLSSWKKKKWCKWINSFFLPNLLTL